MTARKGWPPDKAAPPVAETGGAETESEICCKRNYNRSRSAKQAPRHVGEIADAMLLAAAERRLDRLARRYSGLNAAARIDARWEIETLATLIDTIKAGEPMVLSKHGWAA